MHRSSATTPLAILEASSSSSLKSLKSLHAHAITSGLVRYTYITSRILASYAARGAMDNAHQLFDTIPQPTIFAWNTMIRGHTKSSQPEHGLSVYRRMRRSTVPPNMHTFPISINACARPISLSQIHAHVLKFGFRLDVYVTSSLIKCYADIVSVDVAYKVFDESTNRNIVCWTSLVTGYCSHGQVDRAREVFDTMPERNVVSWSAMITGYVRNDRPEEAVELFRRSRDCSVAKANTALLVGVLSACASLGAFEEGRRIHSDIDGEGIAYGVELGTALVDFYSKCGFVNKAREVFGGMSRKDVMAWSTMIMGLALNGHYQSAIEMFSEMVRSNLKPNAVTFLGVLTACNHGGLVDQGMAYFEEISMVYGMSASIKHYTCVVDLLSRAGRTADAERLICLMPMKPDAAIWGALLNGCMMHGHDKLGEVAGRHVIELEPQHCGRYVGLANVYAAMGRWEGVGKVRSMMRERKVTTTPGWSSIEVNGARHRFLVYDKAHSQIEEIYRILDDLNLEMAPSSYGGMITETDHDHQGRKNQAFCV